MPRELLRDSQITMSEMVLSQTQENSNIFFPEVDLGGFCSTASELTWHVVIIDLDISWFVILHLHVLLHQESVGLRLSSQLKPRNARIKNRNKFL